MQGAAPAQSPFFHPAPQPIQPVAAAAPMGQPMGYPIPGQLPPGVTPVRVHFGGALTRDGVVPVPVYLNRPVGPAPMPSYAPIPAATSNNSAGNRNVRQVSTQAGADAPKETPSAPAVASEDFYTPEIQDPRFAGPDVEDLRRPRLAPRGYRWYSAGEYIHYWVKQPSTPELLLIDGNPITADDVDERVRHGGRFTVGRWLDTHCHAWAIEGSFLFAARRNSESTLTSNGVVTLSRPFFNDDLGVPDELAVAIDPPDLDPRAGSSTIETSSRFYGFEVNLRRELWRSCRGHFDFLLGYRQFHLDEGIAIRDSVVYDAAGGGPLAGSTVFTFDEFGTHNRLFAGQVGLEGELNWRRFYVDAWGKFALGSNQQVINVKGGTTIDGVSTPGGVLALPSNMGQYEDSQFTVLPEVGVHFGVKITPNWRVAAGYTFLYLNNVVRPGDAIDSTVSPTQIPQLGGTPGTRPAPPTFVDADYWAHGITVQMEIRY
jgi:hypothetical protein